MLLLHALAFSARSGIILVIKIAAPSKRDIGTSLAGLVGPAMKPQTLFVFQSGGRGRIRTHGYFHIGGFQDRCIRPLCHPSRSVTSEPHQPIALLSRVLLGSLSFRFGIVRLLHTERLASFSRGILATFRLVCRACSPSPFVVKTVSRFRDILSTQNFENRIKRVKKIPLCREIIIKLMNIASV